MEIIKKKKFTKIMLDENVKAFVVYMTPLNINLILIHLAQKAQIAFLIIKKL